MMQKILKRMTETLAHILIGEGLDGFQKSFHPCALDQSSLRIGRVNCFYPPITREVK